MLSLHIACLMFTNIKSVKAHPTSLVTKTCLKIYLKEYVAEIFYFQKSPVFVKIQKSKPV